MTGESILKTSLTSGRENKGCSLYDLTLAPRPEPSATSNGGLRETKTKSYEGFGDPHRLLMLAPPLHWNTSHRKETLSWLPRATHGSPDWTLHLPLFLFLLLEKATCGRKDLFQCTVQCTVHVVGNSRQQELGATGHVRSSVGRREQWSHACQYSPCLFHIHSLGPGTLTMAFPTSVTSSRQIPTCMHG